MLVSDRRFRTFLALQCPITTKTGVHGKVVYDEPGVPGMAHVDLREINPASDCNVYSQQDVIDIRTHAQFEMLRYRRRARWCHEQMVTFALIWALFAAFFWIADYLTAFIELVVVGVLGGSIIALRRSVEQSDDAYRHWAEVNRSFSEVSVEHYCEIDQLCRQNPAVSRYIDKIAASGRVITYYELRQLGQWVEHHRTETLRLKRFPRVAAFISPWPRRRLKATST